MKSNNDLKVSVAMCTYNGERFVQEQLESIARQSCLPDEIVICDDVSADSTKAILEDFAKSAPFPVRLVFNQENLGYVKNFERAISLCKGDIVFLSDQDDVWRKDKIAVMQEAFSIAEVGMVFSNARTMDEYGNPLNQSLWDKVHFTEEKKIKILNSKAYEVLYFENIVSGCTMAFRQKWWRFVQPLPKDIPFFHDAWIALMISLLTEVKCIKEPLIDYRIHSQQSSIPKGDQQPLLKRKKSKGHDKNDHYRKHLNQLLIMSERLRILKNYIPLEKNKTLMSYIADHEEHLEVRLSRQNNKFNYLLMVLKELYTGRYHRFSNGYKSAVLDIIGFL